MCEINKEIENQINKLLLREYHFLIDYVVIDNGKAVLIKDAYRLLKDHYTHNTLNDKQCEITKQVKQMQSINAKLASLGVSRY